MGTMTENKALKQTQEIQNLDQEISRLPTDDLVFSCGFLILLKKPASRLARTALRPLCILALFNTG